MQKAIPYMAYIPASSGPRPPAVEVQGGPEGTAATTAATATGASSGVERAVTENAVIVIGRRECCMCHVAKRLFQGLGVNPAVYEVDDVDEGVVIKELKGMIRIDDKDRKDNDNDDDQKLQFPAVFVAGRLFGGLEKVMATHISGELVPILREAGALWL